MEYRIPVWRFALVLSVFVSLLLLVAGRMGYLHLVQQSFLAAQGEQRMVREESIAAVRGDIKDRNGEALAVSSPVMSLWLNPKLFDANNALKLASSLGISSKRLIRRLKKNRNQGFMYVKRHLPPELAEKVLAHKFPGLFAETEYRRFYPASAVTAHVVGMTNIDGKGQEGLELAYDDWLQGAPGQQRVVKDLLGNVIKQLNVSAIAKPGSDLKLTLDLRLQYLAYRELKAAVQVHKANWGSAVLLDAQNGDILALVNRPSYNPNNRAKLNAKSMRNRALTDMVEPGSTMKAFTVAAALTNKKYNANSIINTSPGYIRVKRKTIRDHTNYGAISLTKVITKSSNVGVTKLAHEMGAEKLWSMLHSAKLGQATALGFPGEAVGKLPYPQQLDKLGLATLSFGYGLAVTPLQLAQAYTAFANKGCVQEARLIMSNVQVPCEQIMPASVAKNMSQMLETVTQKGGTGTRAKVEGYRVGGKTGTSHKVGKEGYQDSEYTTVFAGIAPISDPRFVLVVVIDQPQGQEYYGGEVAAPVFGRIMEEALRTLQIAPDQSQDFHVAEVSP
ncbi:cell division protein [Oleispira antarctica]|uniref:Peptidoglycan D,D-transpeptidase FtsI n=1 Tax=Oleispira antarctica TaxID=188908 RepID=A0A1Y5HVW6_OLEAN|nr:cell division protein [Oleispira antarctica]